MNLRDIDGLYTTVVENEFGLTLEEPLEYIGTYALVNVKSSKAYIGYTENSLYHRLAQHLTSLKNKTHTSKELIADYERGEHFKVLTFPGQTEQEVFDSWKNELYNRRKAPGGGATGEALYPIERWQKYKGYVRLNRRKKLKRYEVTYGDTSFCIFSLNEFSLVTGLSYSKLYEVAKGKRRSYKGFTLKEV
ncbi:intron-associated endonuclease 1 [Arthronema virus TR020]|uniref:Intron-associated endonuclease 1 n=1 Tax=Arthronema virus TR020 TaxID=2736280 RepID=A0A7G3WH60_9CAUD|nr:intron-associated endonuclease 1 [Arthronema virus TR020]